MSNIKNKIGFRLIGALVLAVFFMTQTAQAAPINISGLTLSDSAELLRRDFPQSFGTIKSFHQGSGKGLIVHIQDAHSNYEIQRHIADILRYLKSKHRFGVVHTEGAQGEIWHRLISSYPDREARALTADYFLREGLVTGPEYEALTGSTDLVLHGVEDAELYKSNREIFLRTLDVQKNDLPALAEVRVRMEAVSRFIFPENYRRLRQYEKEFQEEGRNFMAYVRLVRDLLAELKINASYPQIKNLAALSEMKTQTKESRMMAGALDVDIFTEIRRADEQIREKILTSPEAKRLDGLFQTLTIYEKLFRLSWTKDDADFFYNRPGSFRSSAFKKEMAEILKSQGYRESLPDLSFLDRDLPLMENFYALALKRDQALVSNTLADMKTRGKSQSVLITGGFHTPGIEKALQKSGYSYLVIMPSAGDKMDEAKDREKYLKAMAADSAPMNVLLKASIQDPRFQLNAPTSFPLVNDLKKIPAADLRDFHFQNLVQNHRLGMVLSAVILNSINALRLRGVEAAGLNSQFKPQNDAEKPFAPFYSEINRAQVFYSEGNSGVYMTPLLGPGALSIKGYWHEPSRRDRNLVLRREARVLLTDGTEVEISIADKDDLAMFESKISARKQKTKDRPAAARSDARAKDASPLTGLAQFVYGGEKSEIDAVLFLIAGAVPDLRKQIFDAFQAENVTLDTPVLIRAYYQLENGKKTAVLPPGEKPAARFYRFIFNTPQGRKNFKLKIVQPLQLIEALKAGKEADITFNFSAYTPELNRLDNLFHHAKDKDGKPVSLTQMFSEVGVTLPSYPTIYVTPGNDKPSFLLRPETEKEPVLEVRLSKKENAAELQAEYRDDKPESVLSSEFLGDDFVLFIFLAPGWALQMLRKLARNVSERFEGFTRAGVDSLALKLYSRISGGKDGSGILLKGRADKSAADLSDSKPFIEGGARSELRCGNASIAGMVSASTDLERHLGRLGQSIMITEVRGKISMGFYAILDDGKGNKQVVFEKYIIWKRQQAQDAYDDFKKKVRRAARSMRGPYNLMLGVHLRWPTGGALEKDMYVEEIEAGAHPHQWVGVNTITHNGDFNDLMHNGKKYSNEVVGWRLKRVLKKANNTTGDSPKAAGEFDLRLVQGNWKAVPRYAYDAAVIDGFEDYFGGSLPSDGNEEKNTVDKTLSAAEERGLTMFLENAFAAIGGNDLAAGLKDLAQVNDKTLGKVKTGMLTQLQDTEHMHPAAAGLFERWGSEKSEEFVLSAVNAYFMNDPYHVWIDIMTHFRGSAGINAYSPTTANKMVAVSLISPIYIGYGFKNGELQIGSFSERNAARVEGYEYILKLDPLGEVAEISHDGKEVKIKVYSLTTGKEMDLEQLKKMNRIKPVKPLTPLNASEKADPIGTEQRKMPRNLEITNKEWKGQPTKEVPQPHNVKVAKEFASTVFRSPIGKKILERVRSAVDKGYFSPSLRVKAADAADAMIEVDKNLRSAESRNMLESFFEEMFVREVLALVYGKDFISALSEKARLVSSGLIRGEFAPEELEEKIDDAAFSMLESFYSTKPGPDTLDQLVDRALSEFDESRKPDFSQDVRRAIQESREAVGSKDRRLQRKYLKKRVSPVEVSGADLVLYGKEKNEELFTEWIAFFRKMLPGLKVEFLEPNVILEEAERFTRTENEAGKQQDELDMEGLKVRLGLTNPFVTVLGAGESGQTFPTAVSTTLMTRLGIPEVFVMTADIDSPMADDVGPNRTFLIRSSWSPAEVHVSATPSARLNLLELGLFMTRAAAEKFPDENLLGRTYTEDDIRELERMRDDFLTSSVPIITGFTTKGKLNEEEVPDHAKLEAEGKALGQRINESTDVYVYVAAYLAATLGLPAMGVGFGPIFMWLHALLASTLLAAGPLHLFATIAVTIYGLAIGAYVVRKSVSLVSPSGGPMPKRFTKKLFARATTLAAVIGLFIFAPVVLDIMLYLHLGAPVLPLVRRFFIKKFADKNSRPLQDRTGIKKIIIISKNRGVANLLTIALRKMFNQAYGVNGIEVHATDSYRALDEYSGDRSTWIIILNRDGRIPDSANAESALNMIGKQIKTILSYFFPFAHLFGIPLAGAYILTISSNPKGAAKAGHKHIAVDTETHDPGTISKRRIVQEIYGDTIDAFKQLLEGYVLTASIAKAVATPVWYRPWSYIVSWIWYRTHGGTGVHTTAQPYGADDIIPYLQKMPKTLREIQDAEQLTGKKTNELEADEPPVVYPVAAEGLEAEFVPDGQGETDSASVLLNLDPGDDSDSAIESPEEEAARLLRKISKAKSELRKGGGDSAALWKTLLADTTAADFSIRGQIRMLRVKIEALRKSLKNSRDEKKQNQLQRRLVTAYAKQLTLVHLKQPPSPSREMEIQLIAAELDISEALGVLALLRAVNTEKKRIYPKDLAENFEAAVNSSIAWPLISTSINFKTVEIKRGKIILQNAAAVKEGRLQDIRVRIDIQPEFTEKIPVGGSNTGPFLAEVLKGVVENAMMKAGYANYEFSGLKRVYGGSESKRVFQGYGASLAFLPHRSELREQAPGLGAALDAKDSIRDASRKKKETLLIDTIREAERTGVDLLTALDNFAEVTGIAAAYPAVLAEDQGQFIFNYRASDHSAAFMKNLVRKIESQPRGVEFVIFKDAETSAEEWKALNSKLGISDEIARLRADGREVSLFSDARFPDLESFVADRAQKASVEMPSVMQFVDPASTSVKSKRYIARALLGAVTLANGRIIVAGSKKPIKNARKFSVESVISKTYLAMQALGRSA